MSIGETVKALGPELVERVSHALCNRSLEELVEQHRTEMTGLQVKDATGARAGGGYIWFACLSC